ncbi:MULTISPECIES: type VII secretion target [unclassified Actinopolyspora]|uniref:type VII secretion target n=1 Tax=Actinopolyspora TaxID=1849 RepID=UPI0013F5C114|nr:MULTISPECIES: type VII secretion target [unclassified Actinopolyspora]NHD18903.1 hypothetical protein [Actinopolyspora sp. BKK2]NHE77326.1 hypothetical protein [Actinopolyspora sp. BKK1]
MTDSTKVSTEQLRSHADTVNGFKDKAAKAADAAEHVSGLDDAYGLLCHQMGLPMLLKQPQDSAAQGIRSCAETFEALSRALRDVAKKYEDTDDDQSSELEKITSQMEKLKASNF